jgi:hypothetical protein
MKYLFAAVGLVCVGCAAAAQTEKRTVVNPEGTARFEKAKGAHHVRLVFTTKRFRPAQHRLARSKTCVTIDGHVPLGTDCGVPQVEISAMRLFWDGKEISIPRRFYSDCYSPPFFKDYQAKGIMDRYLAIKFGDKTKAVFVFLHAGDGAGVYDVIWVLRKNGRHVRFTDGGGDCSFLNFDCRPN